MSDALATVRAEVDEIRSHARAHRQFSSTLGRYEAALVRLDRLEGESTAAEVAAVRARVLVGIAACEGELGADREVVLAKLAAAAAMALRAGSAEMVALVHANLGLQLLRSGDHDGARIELDAALDGLVDEAEMLPVLLNRSSLLLEVGAIDDAVVDLRRCLEIARALRDEQVVPMAEHNLGYAQFLAGDLPAALRAMDAAAEAAPPEHAGVGLMDKAAVLYEAGLLTDAEVALRTAAGILAATGGARDLLDAELEQARCLAGLARFSEAEELAERVRNRARRAGHGVMALRAEVVALDSRFGLVVADERRELLRPLAQAADELCARVEDQPGADRVLIDARLLAAEAWARGGRFTESQKRLRALPPRSSLALGARVRGEVVAALCGFGTGSRRAGLAAVRRGYRLLAVQRQQLGAVEAVTAAAVHGIRLQGVDIDAALMSVSPDAFFDALERGRATFAGSGRVRPPDDQQAAELIVSARRLMERARLLRSDEATTDAELMRGVEMHRDARRLQDRARERTWHSGGDRGVPSPTTARGLRAELRAAGSDRVVLNLTMSGGRLRAIRLDGSGARLVDLGPVPPVLELARRVRADQQALANPLLPTPLREVVRASVQAALRRLDALLLGTLDVAGRDVYVAARDRLVSLPWAALPSRRGLSTVVNSWIARGEADWSPGPGLSVAGSGLVHGVAEAEQVAAVWGSGARLLTGADAVCAAVAEAVEGAPVVHVAAHGTHEPENPMFSSLQLADGPLFAHELDGRDLSRSVLVLSACDVGSASIRHGGEPLGLTSVLLRMGARAVIAAVAPLRDDVAVRVMPVLHQGLRDGLRPGAALARAVADEPEPVPLVCFGPLVL
ncbi:CHAT domain-containing protein [Isoptericola sp. NPDC056573]|uniref:CHAT domain-containing protein n=1 Tax=Isoptericola sp. NPDC056573 TaxID=3345868 RepID=UPI003690532F